MLTGLSFLAFLFPFHIFASEPNSGVFVSYSTISVRDISEEECVSGKDGIWTDAGCEVVVEDEVEIKQQASSFSVNIRIWGEKGIGCGFQGGARVDGPRLVSDIEAVKDGFSHICRVSINFIHPHVITVEEEGSCSLLFCQKDSALAIEKAFRKE